MECVLAAFSLKFQVVTMNNNIYVVLWEEKIEKKLCIC